jgi:serine/threonine protein kinase
MLLREIQIWSTLAHDNVLPFYGASLATDVPFMVSRYMKNGNLPKYLRQRPNVNRVQLARLSVFSCGFPLLIQVHFLDTRRRVRHAIHTPQEHCPW